MAARDMSQHRAYVMDLSVNDDEETQFFSIPNSARASDLDQILDAVFAVDEATLSARHHIAGEAAADDVVSFYLAHYNAPFEEICDMGFRYNTPSMEIAVNALIDRLSSQYDPAPLAESAEAETPETRPHDGHQFARYQGFYEYLTQGPADENHSE
ncbi:MAG: hypothetical protein ACPHVN_00820 [Luminiphilus sp.]